MLHSSPRTIAQALLTLKQGQNRVSKQPPISEQQSHSPTSKLSRFIDEEIDIIVSKPQADKHRWLMNRIRHEMGWLTRNDEHGIQFIRVFMKHRSLPVKCQK
jgi:hypothetical protein